MMTIREYEKIFAADCPVFDEISKFSEAGDFLSLGWQRERGEYVQAKNYVGVIQFPSGFQIEILPKLDAPIENLRGLVVKMICTLKDFQFKEFRDADWEFKPTPADMYQMFAYARRYDAKKIILICPANGEGNEIYRADDFEVTIWRVNLFAVNKFGSALAKPYANR